MIAFFNLNFNFDSPLGRGKSKLNNNYINKSIKIPGRHAGLVPKIAEQLNQIVLEKIN